MPELYYTTKGSKFVGASFKREDLMPDKGAQQVTAKSHSLADVAQALLTASGFRKTGGFAAAKAMTQEQRTARARKAALARHAKKETE